MRSCWSSNGSALDTLESITNSDPLLGGLRRTLEDLKDVLSETEDPKHEDTASDDANNTEIQQIYSTFAETVSCLNQISSALRQPARKDQSHVNNLALSGTSVLTSDKKTHLTGSDDSPAEDVDYWDGGGDTVPKHGEEHSGKSGGKQDARKKEGAGRGASFYGQPGIDNKNQGR